MIITILCPVNIVSLLFYLGSSASISNWRAGILRASFRHVEFSLSALAFALVLLFVNVPVLAQVEKYSSKGKLVRIDWFRPLDDKGKPIVLILYGASGGGDSDYFSGCAQQFADAGFVAGVVHYFDSVNIKWANSTQMTANFPGWLGTIGDAITYSQQKFGKTRKIDFFGYSLGAQLALSCASRDARIAAVSSMSGCFVYPPAKVATMPPVLILHGARDSTVSLQREKRTEAQLRQLNSPFETHIYAKQGHCFEPELAQDAVVRTIAFFNKLAQ